VLDVTDINLVCSVEHEHEYVSTN